MDAVYDLVRYVIRAFYTPEHCVVVDGLIREEYVKDEELADSLQMHVKNVRKVLSSLQADFLVESDHQTEAREGGGTLQFYYYYIDFRQFIDATKYRVYKMTTHYQGALDKQQEAETHICTSSHCGKRHTLVDASANFDPEKEVFLCMSCDSPLEELSDSDIPKTAKEDHQALLNQLKPITDCLKNTEDLIIRDSRTEAKSKRTTRLARQEGVGDKASGSAAAANRAGPSQPTTPKSKSSSFFQPTVKFVVDTDVENDKKRMQAQGHAPQGVAPVWFQTAAVKENATRGLDAGAVQVAASENNPVDETTQSEYVKAYMKAAEEAAMAQQVTEAAEAQQAPVEAVMEDVGATDDPMVTANGQQLPFSSVGQEHIDVMSVEEYELYKSAYEALYGEQGGEET